VGSILQTAQLFNVATITGKYNMPSETIGFESSLGLPGAGPSPNLTTYALTAISGADNFNDGSVTIKDVFDVVVSNTRNVTPTCELSVFRSRPFALLILISHESKSEPSGASGTRQRVLFFVKMYSDNSFRPVTFRTLGPSDPLNRFPHSTLNHSRPQFSSSETRYVQPTYFLPYS